MTSKIIFEKLTPVLTMEGMFKELKLTSVQIHF